ncbi:MAG: hypothetical protein ACE5EA_04025 [Nitrospirota bacterium]
METINKQNIPSTIKSRYIETGIDTKEINPSSYKYPVVGRNDTFQDIEKGKTITYPLEVVNKYEMYVPVSPLFHEEILEWWVGHVNDVYEDYFTATLEDLAGKESIAEFDKNEAAIDDQDKIMEGARFIFHISREDHPGGRKIISQLKFLPLYILKESDLDYFQELAERYFPEESETTE